MGGAGAELGANGIVFHGRPEWRAGGDQVCHHVVPFHPQPELGEEDAAEGPADAREGHRTSLRPAQVGRVHLHGRAVYTVARGQGYVRGGWLLRAPEENFVPHTVFCKYCMHTGPTHY